ncbi:MAG: GTP cyclohydrolase II, partial [Candidatus Phosphoribacter sp.]
PGHVVPLRAREGGVLACAGHTEAAVDLCRLAGLAPVGAIAELVADDGTMLRTPEVLALGAATGLPVITIAELVAWRQRRDRVERIADTVLPTRHGTFRTIAYRDIVTGVEHLALVSPRGIPGDTPLARVHSECLTGDVLGSRRCDCGPQLELALELVAAEGGVLVYVRGHEGRGVGLGAKLRAYELQDRGLDTVDAQIELGLPIDAREYAAGAAVLVDLGIGAVRLLTNNPAKVAALREHGIEVAVERLRIAPGPDNRRYLGTKRDRMGHDLVIETTPTGTTA